MTEQLNISRNINHMALFPLVSAIIVTMFLFYIDEGYYSFAWMTEPGAWIIFSIYVFILFSMQFILLFSLFKLLPFLFENKLKIPTVSFVTLLSICLALSLAFYLFSN